MELRAPQPGLEPGTDLLARQRVVLKPIVRALEAASVRDGEFDAVLAWRKASALAALDFLDTASSAAASRFGAAG